MFNLDKSDLFKVVSVSSVIFYSASSMAVNPNVTLPQDINLGLTSFYDGITGGPGWTYLAYAKKNHSTSLKNQKGNDLAIFDKADFDANILINQLDYKFKEIESGGSFGVGAILPIINLSSAVGNSGPGPSLKDNKTKPGDLTLYSYFQFPMTMIEGVPIFSHRLALDVSLPTGGYDKKIDINQSSNMATVIPNWAFTLFLSERLEVSGRVSYMYNFENSSPNGSAPLDFKGENVDNIQAGQAAWLNFASSYKLTPEFYIGINGYYLKQLTDDKVNGQNFSGSKEQVFAIGPGAFWMAQNRERSVWLNVYHESKVENRFKNDYVVQMRYIQSF